MDEKTARLMSQQDFCEEDSSNSFSQYLSFRFYKENFEHLSDFTKDSINNFLKSITEIEEDFMNIMQSQKMKNLELHDFGITSEAGMQLEENY